MPKLNPLKFSFLSLTLVSSLFLTIVGTSFATTTITVEKPVHVTTAEGSDVILDAGEYTLDPAQEWLRVTPSGGNAVDALLLEAQAGKHEESLTDPLAISATGVEPDSHHLVLLLPGGKSLEATGSYSGVRSRGRFSRLSIQRLRALAASKRRAPRTEFVTPSMGGSGGNRSYNLDCGNNAVLVGATFKAGSWLDALGIICQRVNPQTGALGDEFTRGPFGGSGGQAQARRCDDGDVVQGIFVRAGSYVNKAILSCRRWKPSEKAPVFSRRACGIGTGACGKIVGNIFDASAPRNGPFLCPRGKVGKALRGRHGIYIDSMKFVCDLWNK